MSLIDNRAFSFYAYVLSKGMCKIFCCFSNDNIEDKHVTRKSEKIEYITNFHKRLNILSLLVYNDISILNDLNMAIIKFLHNFNHII